MDLQGEKIQNIQNYHSVEFKEETMIFWRYYGVGNGVSVLYNDLTVTSGATMIKPFSNTDKRSQGIEPLPKKSRSDRELCSLLFCMEPGCSSSFETSEEKRETQRESKMRFIEATETTSFSRKTGVHAKPHTCASIWTVSSIFS